MQGQTDKRQSGNISPIWLSASAVYVTVLLAVLFIFIVFCASNGFLHAGSTLFSNIWAPEQAQFGILPMISATLLLSLSALVLGWILAVGVVSYIHAFGNKYAASLLSALIRIMTAIPTVVYGFASVFLLVPYVRDMLGGSGFSWFTATLVLALLITPTMALTIESAVSQIEQESRITAYALGMSRQEYFVYVVLPAARSSLRAAALLGFGRAAGDTMIPTMLAGNAVQYPHSAFDAMRTLTAHIGLVLSSDVGGTAYYSLFVAGGLLFALTLGVNLLFNLIWKKGVKK